MTGTRSNLAAALDYAARMLPVFPVRPRGKDPAVARGFHAATTNPETVKRLWRQADRNIGIPTGSVSGFWVLDVDGDVGETSLRALEAEHGPLPATREVITGSGRHVWFKYRGPIPCAAGRIGPGLDTRGDGGYVIAPPSLHPSGRRYSWSVDSYDQLAAAPDWLERLARKKISERALENMPRPNTKLTSYLQPTSNAYGQAALDDEIGSLVLAAPGTRNAALNCAAFKLFQLVAGGELEDAEVVEHLTEACRRNGLVKDDGLASVRATIKSARKGLKYPRSRSGAA